MDTMRGNYGSLVGSDDYVSAEDEAVRDVTPPAGIGQDERRMQVRAYNHWASLLEGHNYPAIDDLEPDGLPDFGPYSVLLDFSSGLENPGISYLGSELAKECDIFDGELRNLDDVPSRSLLTRITDHYMQILANQAPIGFEAEFINQRGATIAYRGILLPFSSDDDTIDFIYGVINWKELADVRTADELLLEIDQALAPKAKLPPLDDDSPLTDWADGPGAEPANDIEPVLEEPFRAAMPPSASVPGGDQDDGLPVPSFGLYDDEIEEGFEDEADGDDHDDDDDDAASGPAFGSLLKMPIQVSEKPLALSMDAFDGGLGAEADSQLQDRGLPTAIELPELDPSEMELGDWLAAAREMAATAGTSEDRTRSALYEAIGRAYDFSLAASEAPAEFGELLADSGLKMQDRAPMTPVVKLVFGADYDKTRLTEYAAALSHAHRLALPRGSLTEFLGAAEGGLKGVVKAERRLRREEAGHEVEAADAPRLALAKKLRAMPAQDFAGIALDGSEFALVMIRRSETGLVEMIGEVPDDVALVERAARRLIG